MQHLNFKKSLIARNFADRMLGLHKNPNKILIFKTRFGIHTFFLKKKIDILILDKDKKVVGMKESLEPNRILFWNPKYFWVIELPAREIKNLKIKLNDFVNFKN